MHRFGSNTGRSLLTALALAWLCAAASAEPVNYFTGNIGYGGRQIMNGDRPDRGIVNHTGHGRQVLQDRMLGLDFRVETYGIVISHLGIWDDTVYDHATGTFAQALSSPHVLELWDLSTQTLLARITTRPGTGALAGDFRYFRLDEKVFLPQGSEFAVVVGYGRDNRDSNGNSGRTDQGLEPTPTVHDSDGAILGIGGARFGFGTDFPAILDTGPPHRYHSGSFRYVLVEPHPEPGTLAFVLLAAAGGVILVRRRSS